MATPVLPRAQAASNGGGPFTREWYDFFRSLLQFVGDNSDSAAQIQEILSRLEALENEADDPAATINGLASVQVFGSLESGLVQIQLSGDSDSPGNTYYYGTDSTGVKGWVTVASAFTANDPGISLIAGPDGITDVAPDDDLASVEALTGSGIAVRTGVDTWALRTIQAVAGETTVADGGGVAADPTVGLANLSNSGAGTLQAITRDGKGRLSGTKAVTAGTNVTIADIGASIEISAAGGGASAFTDLVDVPASYVGAGGSAVAVKADESGLEFVPFAGGGTVTSIDVIGGVGLDSSGGPVTSSGSITLDLDAATQASLSLADSSLQSADVPAIIGCTFDGGGSAITATSQCDVIAPHALTITKATLLADQVGSIVIDVWVDAYANFPPTMADSITAAAKPTLSSADKYSDSTLTGWTTSVASGAVIRFNVDSCSGISRATLILEGTR